jgi:hypothetical protein
MNDSKMTLERAASSPHVMQTRPHPHPVVQQVAKTQYTTRGHGNQTWVSPGSSVGRRALDLRVAIRYTLNVHVHDASTEHATH